MTKKEKAATRRHKLRKCPFCGTRENDIEIAGIGMWAVECWADGCFAKGPIKESKQRAAKAWNGVK